MKEDIFIFFDTEFTSLNKDADLISVGIVTKDNKHFYAELNDFDASKCNSFVKSDVLPQLRFYNKIPNKVFLKTDPFDYNVLGDKKLVKRSLLDWLSKLPKGEKIFVGDVVMWDWVLLNDLLADYTDGTPQLPKDIHYIPTDIATILRSKDMDPDVDRQQFCGKQLSKLHNALEDAKLAMWCWDKLYPEKSKS